MLIYLCAIEGQDEKQKFEIIYEEYKNLMFYVALLQVLLHEKNTQQHIYRIVYILFHRIQQSMVNHLNVIH